MTDVNKNVEDNKNMKSAGDKARDAIEAAKAKAATASPAAVADEKAGSPTPGEKKLSPKNKLSRGVDPSLITTWVPLDQSKAQNTIMQNAAKHRNVNVGDLLAKILAEAIKNHLPALQADANLYEPKAKGTSLDDKLEKMDENELEEFANRQLAIMEAMKIKIAAAKAAVLSSK